MSVDTAVRADRPEVIPAPPAPPPDRVWTLRARTVLACCFGVVVAVAVAAAATLAVLAASLHGWSAAVTAAHQLVHAGVSTSDTASSLAELATPLLVGGVAVMLALRGGLLNVGVGGQVLAGMLAAALVRADVPGSPHVRLLASVGAAVVAGAIWALPPALLRAYRGVSEILTTPLLAVVAGVLTGAAVTAGRITLPQVTRSPSSASLALTLVAALVVAAFVGLGRTGRQLQLLRADHRVAAAAGVPVRRRLVQLLVASGAVAGLLGLPALGAVPRSAALLGSVGLGATPGRAGPELVWLVGLGALAVGLLGRRSVLALLAGAVVVAAVARAGAAAPALGVPWSIAPLAVAALVLTVSAGLELGMRWADRSGVAAGRRVLERALGQVPGALGSPAGREVSHD